MRAAGSTAGSRQRPQLGLNGVAVKDVICVAGGGDLRIKDARGVEASHTRPSSNGSERRRHGKTMDEFSLGSSNHNRRPARENPRDPERVPAGPAGDGPRGWPRDSR